MYEPNGGVTERAKKVASPNQAERLTKQLAELEELTARLRDSVGSGADRLVGSVPTTGDGQDEACETAGGLLGGYLAAVVRLRERIVSTQSDWDRIMEQYG